MFEKTASRPHNFAPDGSDVTGGPGAYNAGKNFGEDVPNMTIGHKREQVIAKGPGPGEYNPEVSDAKIKYKTPNAIFGNSPSRPESFAPDGSNVTGGPGAYNEGKKFGEGVPTFTIG